MQVWRAGLLGLVSGLVVAGTGMARTVGDFAGPAELPPSSYTQGQYVDSDGCVYVRAGYGGVVNWVPRVSRDHQVLCGYAPSFGGTAQAAAAPVPDPVAIATVSAAPASAAATAKGPAPAQTPQIAVAQTPRTAQIPGTGTAVPPPRASARALRQLPAVVVPAGRAACPRNMVGLERYQLNDGRVLVRCGVAMDAPGSYRILSADAGAVPIPKGYQRAWKDGRLNPNRGERTPEGRAAMRRLWSDAVPARRISAPKPLVLAPVVSTKSVPVAVVVAPVAKAVARAAAVVPASVVPASVVPASVVPAAVAPASAPPAPVAAASGARYVQVGAFAVADNAARSRATLAALGLPVSGARTTMGGKAVQIVLAGPFVSNGDVVAALAAARGAGFPDAFARR